MVLLGTPTTQLQQRDLPVALHFLGGCVFFFLGVYCKAFLIIIARNNQKCDAESPRPPSGQAVQHGETQGDPLHVLRSLIYKNTYIYGTIYIAPRHNMSRQGMMAWPELPVSLPSLHSKSLSAAGEQHDSFCPVPTVPKPAPLGDFCQKKLWVWRFLPSPLSGSWAGLTVVLPLDGTAVP